MNTEKQKLAQKRNYFKFILAGMFRPIQLYKLTDNELSTYNEMIELHAHLLKNFDYNSLQLGLKVPVKCWCGKEGKYVPEYIESPLYKLMNSTGLVCRKHIKD